MLAWKYEVKTSSASSNCSQKPHTPQTCCLCIGSRCKLKPMSNPESVDFKCQSRP
uniref:Uncharacterized protein n=1 Tax=Anguilla anguilla TaxID=7936 RepID=A0A0E9WXW6_ANGAN